MRRIRVISICAALLLSGGCGAVSDSDEKVFFNHREAEDIERQYLYLATYIDSAKPCFLIHPESLSIAPANSGGTRVSFVRSTCFRYVASHTGSAGLCEHVRSVSTFLYSGNRLDAANCRELASTAGAVRWSHDLNTQEIVELAGYSDRDIDAFLVSEGIFPTLSEAEHKRRSDPASYWYDVRLSLLHSRDFFDRIDDLPGFADGNDREAMEAVSWQPRQMNP